MLTRTVIILLCVLAARSDCYAADPLKGAIYIADGTANLALLARVTDARTRQPVSDATVTAVRAGRGTTLLASDSTAMPSPARTDLRGRAVLHTNFRCAGDPSGSCVFVARSFLRVQASGFRTSEIPISAIGRLDFAPKTKHYQVTLPIALARE